MKWKTLVKYEYITFDPKEVSQLLLIIRQVRWMIAWLAILQIARAVSLKLSANDSTSRFMSLMVWGFVFLKWSEAWFQNVKSIGDKSGNLQASDEECPRATESDVQISIWGSPCMVWSHGKLHHLAGTVFVWLNFLLKAKEYFWAVPGMLRR